MEQTLGIMGYDDPDFDPFAAYDRSHGWEAVQNPYPEIARRRSEAPVHAHDFRASFGSPPDSTLVHLPHYSVYGHAQVLETLTDSMSFSNAIYEHNIGKGFGRSITLMDPPDHPRYRRLFQKAFLPKQIASWGSDHVEPVVNDLIDRFLARERAELVSEFTMLYPFHFIYRQLGLPQDDVETFHALAAGLMCVSTDMEHGLEANAKLGAYFEMLLEERRRIPRDDLVSQLVLAEVDGEKLPDDIIVAFLRQLLNAGGDTTFRATGSALAALLTDRDQLDLLRNDRSRMPQAIAEAMRWEPPTTAILRTPVRDLVLGGVMVPAGAALDVVIAAANRDPAEFEDPDRFDMRRPAKRVLTFGSGIHICIGQYLARMEMGIALNILLDRLPRLRLDESHSAPRIIGLTKRSPDRLFVRFD